MNHRLDVLKANKKIISEGLSRLTWGNVSVIDEGRDKIYIKPSGADLDKIHYEDISVVSMSGDALSGMKPSVDTNTHLLIYENFKNVGAIVHTHSKFATVFAQSNLSIPCFGTTHADYFYGDIPVVYDPNPLLLDTAYEKAVGESIVEYFNDNNLKPLFVPACLCPGHGVFTWGRDLNDAVNNAIIAELVAEMAYHTISLRSSSGKDVNKAVDKKILDKHFLRKHGEKKYYGQR